MLHWEQVGPSFAIIHGIRIRIYFTRQILCLESTYYSKPINHSDHLLFMLNISFILNILFSKLKISFRLNILFSKLKVSFRLNILFSKLKINFRLNILFSKLKISFRLNTLFSKLTRSVLGLTLYFFQA